MSIKQKVENDLKSAMLAGDKFRVMTLRGLKSDILNVEVAEGLRDEGLSDAKIIDIFSKEVKKRQESAEFYKSGGNEEKLYQELAEREIILEYLPKQLDEAEIKELVQKLADEKGITDIKQLGQLIGLVKQQTAGSADGAVIARLAKEQLAE